MDVRLAIVGGKLQGLEAVYLAKKAGFKSILIDKRQDVPAVSLAAEFHNIDVVKEQDKTKKLLKDVDGVVPALENYNALHVLKKLCKDLGKYYLQDNKAFLITSKKDHFLKFCDAIKLPYPKLFPDNFPVIVKPVKGSGSKDVYLVKSKEELDKLMQALNGHKKKVLVQECAHGFFLSLELLGLNGLPLPLQVTCLEFDAHYSCKRVLAPFPIEWATTETLRLGERLVCGLQLTGLTDIQVVAEDNGSVKVIEANARLPSQTPTVVYHSTGVNILQKLFELFREGIPSKVVINPRNAVIYQHVAIVDKTLHIVGERVLSSATNLELKRKFFGVDEAITNFDSAKNKTIVSTLISCGKNLTEAKEKMERALELIVSEYDLKGAIDTSPPNVRCYYDQINVKRC